MKTLSAKEFACNLFASIMEVDPENITYTKNVFGGYDTNICFRNGGHVRVIRSSDPSIVKNANDYTTISIYNFPGFPEENGHISYNKLSTEQKKDFLYIFEFTIFELCVTDDNYAFFQETLADKISDEVHNGGEKMNIVTRKHIVLSII